MQALRLTAVLGAAVIVLATGVPARARTASPPPCDRFAIAAAPPFLADVTGPKLDTVVFQGKRLMLGASCMSRPASIRKTADGWRIKATWKTCGTIRKAVLKGTIDTQCQALSGTIRAKRQPPADFVARTCRCGDGIALAGCGEECDPDDGGSCVQCRTVMPPSATTTATTVTPTSTTVTTTTTTLPPGPRCGDGVRDPGEECDRAHLGGAHCEGSAGGAHVTCTDQCTLDRSGCCGNGVLEAFEQCDSDDLGDARCPDDSTAGAFVGCGTDCRLDWSQCPSCAGQSFGSTWEAIQQVIFARHDCTNDACHGAARQGGLDLHPTVAYDNLFEVPSSQVSETVRLEPGDQRRSYLWLKLAAKTDPALIPEGVTVGGNPMPSVGPALTPDELELLRLWIYAGAPEDGTVRGTDALAGACLPPPRPLIITPLDPPAPGQGVQFTMPPWELLPRNEREICFASYYDFTGQVPPEFLSPDGKSFRFSSQELRQDPQSHHLILYRYPGTADADYAAIARDAIFGQWTCVGGERDGQPCQPTVAGTCGDGLCGSTIRDSFACIGFGPAFLNDMIGGAQKAQAFDQYAPGVFAQIPLRGIVMWNSHAFNLSTVDTHMHAWLNYYFASDQRYPLEPIFNFFSIFAADGTPPYQKRTVCSTEQLPRYARLFSLSSHSHKRGEQFWITHPDGRRLYENFNYNDPPNKTFTPPLAFDSRTGALRQLRYCATYNNGVRSDGSPDPETVTRRSRMPNNAPPCEAVACVAGRIGAPCGVSGNLAGNDRACDSSPGAGDGWCDACAIVGGESTENEMFILIGSFFVQPPGS